MFVEHKEVGEVTEQPTQIQRLSQAMRLGSLIRPECREVWKDGVGSCAVLAAGEATGFPYSDGQDGQKLLKHLMQRFPGITCHLLVEAFRQHDKGMSRQEVADWLEAQGY